MTSFRTTARSCGGRSLEVKSIRSPSLTAKICMKDFLIAHEHILFGNSLTTCILFESISVKVPSFDENDIIRSCSTSSFALSILLLMHTHSHAYFQRYGQGTLYFL